MKDEYDQTYAFGQTAFERMRMTLELIALGDIDLSPAQLAISVLKEIGHWRSDADKLLEESLVQDSGETPATAKDEREAFEEWWGGRGLPENVKALFFMVWKARAARYVQTEQQPVAWLIDWPEEAECVEAFDLCDGSGARVVYEDDHVAALSAVTTERNALRERVTELSSGTVDPADVCAIEEELNQLRAEVEALREALTNILNIKQESGDAETFQQFSYIHAQKCLKSIHSIASAAMAAKEDV